MPQFQTGELVCRMCRPEQPKLQACQVETIYAVRLFSAVAEHHVLDKLVLVLHQVN